MNDVAIHPWLWVPPSSVTPIGIGEWQLEATWRDDYDRLFSTVIGLFGSPGEKPNPATTSHLTAVLLDAVENEWHMR